MAGGAYRNTVRSSVFAEFGQYKVGVVFGCPVDVPFAGEQQEVLAFEILYSFCVGGEVELFGVDGIIVDPAYQLIGHTFKDNIYIIFVFQAVFEHLKLKNAHNAHNDLFHAAAKILENLKFWNI